MKALRLMPLMLILGVVPAAWANSGGADDAALFKTPVHEQDSFLAEPLLQLAQVERENECLGKCHQEAMSCHESGKSEAESGTAKSEDGKAKSDCGTKFDACQQECADQM